jgi:hypothetical protein
VRAHHRIQRARAVVAVSNVTIVEAFMKAPPDIATAHYAAGQAVAHSLYGHKFEKVSVLATPKQGRRCKIQRLKPSTSFTPNR